MQTEQLIKCFGSLYLLVLVSVYVLCSPSMCLDDIKLGLGC